MGTGTLGTSDLDNIVLAKAVPALASHGLEVLDRFLAPNEFESLIFYAGVDFCPRKARSPEVELAVANAIFQEVTQSSK